MSLEQFSLNATNLTGLNYTTEELLQYSPVSVAALIAAGFKDEFLVKGIDEKINGSGVGEPEGVMNSPAIISVAKEVGQAADTITYTNILAMRARCYGYGNAVWIANHDALPTLAKMSFVVGTGGSAVFVPNTNPATLLGRPLFFTEYAKTVGDTGDILLINPTQYLEGTLQPMQSAESVHVRFETHERTFKFWIANDGKSWWRAALTPKNSTATLSPFVKLDARA
jgi:HK97 family phage major capsid protein